MKKIIAALLIAFTCVLSLSALSKKDFEQKVEQFITSSKSQYVKITSYEGYINYIPKSSVRNIVYSEEKKYIDVFYGTSHFDVDFESHEVTITTDSSGNLIIIES